MSMSNRPTFLFRSITELNANLNFVADAIRSGVEVYVGKITPTGRSVGYAMFNVERWDPTNRVPYTALMENNGLPDQWRRILNPIVDYST